MGKRLDVGQAEVVVCARVPDRQGRRCKLIESFGTTTPDLLALADWLGGGLDVTHVAMESTGMYWRAPYYDAGTALDQLLQPFDLRLLGHIHLPCPRRLEHAACREVRLVNESERRARRQQFRGADRASAPN